MPLSNEERQALRDRAAGLRAEVSSLEAARDGAVQEASNDLADQKLLKEIGELEQRKEAAQASLANASGSVEDAMKVMEAAAGQASTVSLTDRPVTTVADKKAEVK